MLTPGDVDWRAFDGLPEHAVSCRCGRAYRSHAIRVRDYGCGPGGGDGAWVGLSEAACPGCGRFDDVRRIECATMTETTTA